MDIEKLETLKKQELESGSFQPPPHQNYRELTESILNNAADDINEADQIRVAIKDLFDTRQAKLFTSMKSFINQQEVDDVFNTGQMTETGKTRERQKMHGDMENITQLEICLVRDSVLAAMDIKKQLQRKKNFICDTFY